MYKSKRDYESKITVSIYALFIWSVFCVKQNTIQAQSLLEELSIINEQDYISSVVLFYYEFLESTSEDVVLVVLVSLCPHFNETDESLSNHKLMHQVLIIL